jgi:hypothetical protein
MTASQPYTRAAFPGRLLMWVVSFGREGCIMGDIGIKDDIS